jgi:predicted ATP-binding protein involved in virulence
MKLQRLRLTNFRCFSSLEMEIDSRLTVFIGINATGKTALVEAINIGLGPIMERLRRLYAIRLQEHDLRRGPDGAPMPFVEIFLETSNPELRWDLELLRDHSPVTRQEMQTFRKTADRRRFGRKQLHGYLDDLIECHRQQQVFEIPVFAFYEADRAAKDAAGPKAEVDPYYERFSAYVKAHRAGVSFAEAVSWFNRTQHEAVVNPGSPATHAFEIVRHAVKRLLPKVESLAFHPAEDRLVARFRSPTQDLVELPVSRLSHGYQGMLALVMDFARRMALANPHLTDPLAGEGICLIDEVDLHLHPDWQQRVIPGLLEVFPGTQFILTTHSPQVLTTVPPQHIRRIDFHDGHHVLQVPTSSLGAESSRVLEDVMGVNPRPRRDAGSQLDTNVHGNVSAMLQEYLTLVAQRQGRSEKAIHLRADLDRLTNREDPQLERADAEMRRQELFS